MALSKYFESEENTELCAKKWFKEYKNVLQRCFEKIRIPLKCNSSEFRKIQNQGIAIWYSKG